MQENCFQGVPLNAGKSSDRLIDQKEFFKAIARNAEERLLCMGGRRGQGETARYSRMIDELKVLYPQYWPENTGLLFGESEVESVCERFRIDCPRVVLRAFKDNRSQMNSTTFLSASIQFPSPAQNANEASLI